MIKTWKIVVSCALVLVISIFLAHKFDVDPGTIIGLCHRRPTNFKSHLSSIAPYRFVGNRNDSPVFIDGCRATLFYGLFRHGTRNPSEKLIKGAREILLPLRDKIVRNHDLGKGSLCASDIAHLRDWKVDLHDRGPFDLTEEGGREHRELGRRFKNRFPELLSVPYNEKYYEFYYTSTTRTAESARNFSIGVFGEEYKSIIKYKDTAESDPIIRFYKFCDKWKKEVRDSDAAKIEKKIFENGPEVTKVRKTVSERLGLSDTLSVDDLSLIYKFCAFGIAWDDSSPSAWCSTFSEDELEVLQYIKDLNHYAKSGYKSEITYKQACPAVKNVFEFFSSSDVNKPAVKFNFAHSGTILKFLASLGLYKNPHHLRAADYASNINREWKGSVIDSFAANIVFILYECGKEKKVLTLHQEKAIALPGCPNPPELCPLDYILELYKDHINNCDMKAMCSVSDER